MSQLEEEEVAIQTSRQTPVCALDDIVPNAGVCALVDGDQVTVFHAGNITQAVYAIGSYDPNAHAAILSRRLIGNLGKRIIVTSSIYKQHFDLTTGECLEVPANSVHAYTTKVENDAIWAEV